MYREKVFRETNNNSSYQIQRVSGHQETEINRLGAQVDLFWEKELKHYKEYGLTDGMSVVELGSGPGFLTEKLLELFPRLEVVSVEVDPHLAEMAEDRLKKKFPGRIAVVQGNINNTCLPDDAYDFAIIRLLIEHLSDPVGAAREVHRILMPGGKAVFIDNDFELHLVTYPPIPELKELYDAYCRARTAEGGRPLIGRELPIIMRKAGFTNIDFEVIAAHNEIVGDDIFFKSQGVGIPTKLVQDGYLKSTLLGQISRQWRNIIRNQDHAIIRQLYMGFGEKIAHY